MLQFVLILRWNVTYLHMSDYFFALGDDVISAYIAGLQYLPVCIMYMRLCPEGSEGPWVGSYKFKFYSTDHRSTLGYLYLSKLDYQCWYSFQSPEYLGKIPRGFILLESPFYLNPPTSI